MNTLVSYSIMTSTMTYDPGSLEYKFSVRFWGGRLGIFLFFISCVAYDDCDAFSCHHEIWSSIVSLSEAYSTPNSVLSW